MGIASFICPRMLDCKLEGTDVVAEKFRECARMYTEGEFQEAYSELCNTYHNVAKYMDGSVDEAKWASCYFPGEMYNIDTSNCVESMNSIFLDARKYSLLPMIDAIVAKLAEWFNKHRNESVAASDAHKLVPFVENLVHGRVAIARKLLVSELNYFHHEYNVIGRDGKTYLVNLRRKTCGCKYFDIDKYPCVHAIADTIVFMKRAGRTEDIHVEELCSKYYLMETWALAYYMTIYLVPHKSQWIIPDDIQQLCALSPYYKKRRGRRQITRHPSVGERRRRTSDRPVRGQGEGLFSYFNCSRDSMDSSEV